MSDEGVGKGTGEIPDGPFYPGTTQLETIEERLAALEEVQRGNCESRHGGLVELC
jgi:hypothetical protein